MPSPSAPPAPDYLVLGHLSLDHSPAGPRLGGTAAYAALTARALGRRPAIVTAGAADLDLAPLTGLPVARQPSPSSTTFENLETKSGRRQRLLARAEDIRPDAIPESWRAAAIVHLAPLAAELAPSVVDLFDRAGLLCITAQGWMRGWNDAGEVAFSSWVHAAEALRQAQAVVVSLEDLGGDEDQLEELASVCGLLVVTGGAQGARVYWNRDVRRFPAPPVSSVDPTGAGDVFAAAFFVRYEQTRDPWEAARFANRLAAASTLRPGLRAAPTPDEIERASVVVVP
jgi:sugar/nucleoside kinase (ribokinase family)